MEEAYETYLREKDCFDGLIFIKVSNTVYGFEETATSAAMFLPLLLATCEVCDDPATIPVVGFYHTYAGEYTTLLADAVNTVVLLLDANPKL